MIDGLKLVKTFDIGDHLLITLHFNIDLKLNRDILIKQRCSHKQCYYIKCYHICTFNGLNLTWRSRTCMLLEYTIDCNDKDPCQSYWYDLLDLQEMQTKEQYLQIWRTSSSCIVLTRVTLQWRFVIKLKKDKTYVATTCYGDQPPTKQLLTNIPLNRIY